MDIILLAGLWLPASIWSQTADEIERLGCRAIPVALPGVDDVSVGATLDDQIEATLSAIDAVERAVIVGHSAAATLAWIAADRRPLEVARVVMIGGFPSSSGASYADFFETTNREMPFPGWEPFEGPDSADLDEADRQRIAQAAIPVPEGVSQGIVRLTDERRFDVPVALVCPEFGPDQARGWIDDGQIPELASVVQVSYHDIDSGHWPMVTQPVALAGLLDAIAGNS